MNYMNEKFKAAKAAAKRGDGSTAWGMGASGGKKQCPGCAKRYDKMSAGQLKGHAKAMQSGRQKDCPDT
jgi:hypothetical protein